MLILLCRKFWRRFDLAKARWCFVLSYILNVSCFSESIYFVWCLKVSVSFKKCKSFLLLLGLCVLEIPIKTNRYSNCLCIERSFNCNLRACTFVCMYVPTLVCVLHSVEENCYCIRNKRPRDGVFDKTAAATCVCVSGTELQIERLKAII